MIRRGSRMLNLFIPAISAKSETLNCGPLSLAISSGSPKLAKKVCSA